MFESFSLAEITDEGGLPWARSPTDEYFHHCQAFFCGINSYL